MARKKVEKPRREVQRPGRKCSICAHSDVKSINASILKATPFRVIACQVWGNDSKRASLMRHTDNCLNAEIAAVIQQRKIDNAVDAFSELCEQLDFAKAIRTAAREYLNDEKGNISLAPRADEIDVLYWDLESVPGVPTKAKAPLDELLERAQSDTVRPVRPYIKGIDMREFALKAINTTDSIVDKFIKIEGLYTKERDNPDELRNTIEAIKFFLDKHPEADREEVIEAYAIPKGFSKDQIIQNLEGVQ